MNEVFGDFAIIAIPILTYGIFGLCRALYREIKVLYSKDLVPVQLKTVKVKEKCKWGSRREGGTGRYSDKVTVYFYGYKFRPIYKIMSGMYKGYKAKGAFSTRLEIKNAKQHFKVLKARRGYQKSKVTDGFYCPHSDILFSERDRRVEIRKTAKSILLWGFLWLFFVYAAAS